MNNVTEHLHKYFHINKDNPARDLYIWNFSAMIRTLNTHNFHQIDHRFQHNKSIRSSKVSRAKFLRNAAAAISFCTIYIA